MTRIELFGRWLMLSVFPLVLVACTSSPARHDFPKPLPPREGDAPGGILKIHTLPVGAGNCQVVQCPSQNKMIVLDCGSKGKGRQGWDRAKVARYIHAMIDGGTEVVVTVSHPDGDHYNYLPEVFRSVRVRALYLGAQRDDYDDEFNAWVANAERLGMSVSTHRGFHASSTPDPRLSCLRPGDLTADVAGRILGVNAGVTSNDASMVVSMRYGNFQALFTGDMTGATEHAIRAAGLGTQLGSTVVTGAHHGADSLGSNSHAWAQATRPKLLLFSAGKRFHHPRCVSVDNYREYVEKRWSAHLYHCGHDGAYWLRESTDAVLVTNDNGLIVVDGRSDGSFQASWWTSGRLGRRGTWISAPASATSTSRSWP